MVYMLLLVMCIYLYEIWYLTQLLFLSSVGELYSWGCNSNGQLGIGTISYAESKANLIKSLHGLPISHIACGGNFSFIVSRSGKTIQFRYFIERTQDTKYILSLDVQELYMVSAKTRLVNLD